MITVIVMAPWLSIAMLVGVINKGQGMRLVVKWIRFFLKIFHIEISVPFLENLMSFVENFGLHYFPIFNKAGQQLSFQL